MYLTDGKARLYHLKHHSQIIFFDYNGPTQHPLMDLFIAAPRIPMAYYKNFEFSESFYGIVRQGWLRGSIDLLKVLRHYPLNPSPGGAVSVDFRFDSDSMKLESTNLFLGFQTFCQFDPFEGLTQFGVGSRSYRVVKQNHIAASCLPLAIGVK
jgi:hypothetical protein